MLWSSIFWVAVWMFLICSGNFPLKTSQSATSDAGLCFKLLYFCWFHTVYFFLLFYVKICKASWRVLIMANLFDLWIYTFYLFGYHNWVGFLRSRTAISLLLWALQPCHQQIVPACLRPVVFFSCNHLLLI